MNPSNYLLKAEGLTKIYGNGKNRTVALDRLSFQVFPGEFLGIMGASGSGKTTLLNCIATMQRPDSGKILLNGTDLLQLRGKELADYRGKKLGYLFQNFELLENLTARENILLPVSIHGIRPEKGERLLMELAKTLDLADILDQFPDQLSGGQKQRTAAARALILKPEILLADEPTGALDLHNASVLLECLERLNRQDHVSIFMVSHDPNAASYCTRILNLSRMSRG